MTDDRPLSLDQVPGRVFLDTCIINTLHDEGGYIFDADDPVDDSDPASLEALRIIFMANQRAAFQLMISPLSIMEIANTQDTGTMLSLLNWVLELRKHWAVVLDDTGDRAAEGGTVRHRFKLSPELQGTESELMAIPDLKRDPVDRLLLLEYKMANCDAFMTNDRNTIWRHREQLLANHGIRVVIPDDYLTIIKPFLGLWC